MLADQFDRWTQNFDTRIARRSLSGVILAALVGVELAAGGEAKKKKKKKRKEQGSAPSPPPQDPGTLTCAQQCADGCCPSEFGDCILPAQPGGGAVWHRG